MSGKRRIGLLLSGCGALDGSDPHEAIFTMLAIQRKGHDCLPITIDEKQFHCVDHASGIELAGEERSQLVESARLVRGKLYTVPEIAPKLLNGLVIPGGQGVVKNLLTNFGVVKTPEVAPVIKEFLLALHEAGAVIASLSLGEFLLSGAFGPWDEDKGCLNMAPGEVLVDAGRGLLMASGSLNAGSLAELSECVNNLCDELLRVIEGRDTIRNPD